MDIQASIVVNRPAEAVFAYLSSEEHIAVLGQRAGFGQEANEDNSKRRPYNNIPVWRRICGGSCKKDCER